MPVLLRTRPRQRSRPHSQRPMPSSTSQVTQYWTASRAPDAELAAHRAIAIQASHLPIRFCSALCAMGSVGALCSSPGKSRDSSFSPLQPCRPLAVLSHLCIESATYSTREPNPPNLVTIGFPSESKQPHPTDPSVLLGAFDSAGSGPGI